MFIVSSCFLASTSIIGCGRSEKPKVTEKEPPQQILTFTIGGFTTGGKKDWELEGKSANIDGDIIDLNTITLKSYKDNNNMVLTSDNGRFDRSKSYLHLYNNVVMTNADGMKMTTDALDWSMKTKEITNDSFVTITKGTMKVTGTGLYGQTDSKKAQLKKDVTVNIEPSTVITCKGALEIDYDKNIATFNKDVVAIDKRGTITADKADVYFNPEKRSMEKVILTGNPKVIFIQEENKDVSFKGL